ncbi:uncharacterized protein LOC141630925 [Silene latifolia]|uniref:uncharacterized protein LOC141630925 n=1 Tax=Silene latifolia TaxID=37657 RepID=UPI003D77BE41
MPAETGTANNNETLQLELSGVGQSPDKDGQGGIGFWWRDIDAELVVYDKNHVVVDVKVGNGSVSWRAVGIYGWPESENKHRTWSMLRRIREASNLPMVLFGDFNEILSPHEKEGGSIRRECHMDAFLETMDVCGFRDLGFRCNKFTWQRGLSEDTYIRERLDRVIASEEWCGLFPRVVVHNGPVYASDHSPLLVKKEVGGTRSRRGRGGFKFEPYWATEESCGEVVMAGWGVIGDGDVEGKVARVALELKE